MATNYSSSSGDGRQWTPSPRPKGRENAKNIPCRNIAIYGYCKHEKDGCIYNHDLSKQNASQFQSDSTKKRLNVDSPSFTPTLIDPSAAKVASISPKAAFAAPFTPKIAKAGTATPPLVPAQQIPDWAKREIPEFVPQNFGSVDNSTGPPITQEIYNPYADTASFSTLEGTPPSGQVNPYGPDAASAAGAPLYQNQNAFAQPLQHHLYAPVGPHKEHLPSYQRTVHDFFIAENVRQDLQRKADLTLQILPASNLPSNIEHFHSLVPLDMSNQKDATAFGYNTWLYKAFSGKDGYTYALRRVEGFRLTSEKAIRSMQAWKRLGSASVVTIHDCFTTRAFGDSSLILVSDYHPNAKTLNEQHFSNSPGFSRSRVASSVVPEQVLWSYLVQIASALRTIHTNGLAARCLVSSKVIITDKNRIRLTGCAIPDIVYSNESRPLTLLQKEDMQQMGRLILALGTQSPNATPNTKSLEAFGRTYGTRLKDCVSSLTENARDVESFLGTIVDRVIEGFDSALHAEDALMSSLYRELENGRLVRLLSKLGTINERPESNDHSQGQGSSQWSETGERYFLKLFRDYVFHQVSADGRPIVDLGHILTCLNKMDAGIDEKITLVTRDEQNIVVVSYKELKRGLESSFQDLVKASRRS